MSVALIAGMPDAAGLAALKLSPEVAWYLLDRSIGLPEPWQAPLIKTPEPGELRADAVFDPERVDKVLRTFRYLRHTKGDYAGRPLVPDIWQTAHILAPIFGWVAPDAAGRLRRIIREAWIELPRKGGKSTLVGGIGIYMSCADGESGAECVAAASTEKQAGFVFDPVRSLVKNSPDLGKYAKAYQKKIIHEPTMSEFGVVSSVGDGLHGANLHFYVVDEVHVHKSPELIEAIETGTGSRSQPLGVLITTADAGAPDTIYARKRVRIVSLADGLFRDAGTYGVIWAAALSEEDAKTRGLDLLSAAAQRAANPGYGVSPTAEYLERQALIASQSPADYSKYLRLHLNIRTRQATTYITVDAWDRNMGVVERSALLGRRCTAGLDLASTSDFTAWAMLFPAADGASFDVLWRFWIPEVAYDALVKRTSKEAQVWRRRGLFRVTEGDVVDDEQVVKDIQADCDAFRVTEIGYDPWNSSAIVNALGKGGAKLVPVRQGYPSLSAPLKHIKKLVHAGTPEVPLFRHGGNAVARWMLGNLAVAMDEQENVKPDRARSADKIDGIAAVTIAMARVLTQPATRRSAYADKGLGVA